MRGCAVHDCVDLGADVGNGTDEDEDYAEDGAVVEVFVDSENTAVEEEDGELDGEDDAGVGDG